MTCPQYATHHTLVKNVVRRWLGAEFDPCAVVVDSQCILLDEWFYPALSREYNEFRDRLSTLIGEWGVRWRGDCYDCEDFAQLASALFSAMFAKNACLKAYGRLHYEDPSGRRYFVGYHAYNVVLLCVEDDYARCVDEFENMVVPVILEPQIPMTLPPWHPCIELTDGRVCYETVKVVPPG